MRAYAYILHKLVRVLDGLPSEAAAAALCGVLTYPGVFWFVVFSLVGSVVSAWVVAALAYHVWPEIPPEHRRFLLALWNRTTLRGSPQDLPALDRDESPYSRNSKRHPHW